MFKCFATVLMWVIGFVVPAGAAFGSSSADGTRLVHTLSLQVSVDGKQIMDPVFQMTSAAPAQLFIGTEDGNGHTLVVNIVEAEKEGRHLQTSGVHFVLWKGEVNSGIRLLDEVLVLGEGRRLKGAGDALRSRVAGQDVSVTVISHATQLRPQKELPTHSSCPGVDGSEGANPGSKMVKSGKSNCCSAKCQDGSGGTLKCCNVISGCCQCGACCSIP